MNKNVEYKTGEELAVKTIFGEDFDLPTRLLHARTESSKNIRALADAIELIVSYNEFEGKKVADALRELHSEGIVECAEFGRECSPVLYVKPFISKDREGRKKSFYIILEKLKETNPDELNCLDARGYFVKPSNHAFKVRAWWD